MESVTAAYQDPTGDSNNQSNDSDYAYPTSVVQALTVQLERSYVVPRYPKSTLILTPRTGAMPTTGARGATSLPLMVTSDKGEVV